MVSDLNVYSHNFAVLDKFLLDRVHSETIEGHKVSIHVVYGEQ